VHRGDPAGLQRFLQAEVEVGRIHTDEQVGRIGEEAATQFAADAEIDGNWRRTSTYPRTASASAGYQVRTRRLHPGAADTEEACGGSRSSAP
jgi:hypothetical protein